MASPAAADGATDREAGPASRSRPRCPPRDAFRHPTRPSKREVSLGRARGLAESSTAEESDERPQHDGLKNLIAGVDRVQARWPAGEEHLRGEGGGEESD